MLDARGFRQSDEASRAVPETPAVLVTAHGISDRERARLRNAGKALVDTTCPLVQKVHDAAQALQRDGRRVVVIGRPGHVEVRGIVEDLTDPVVIWSADDVRAWASSSACASIERVTTRGGSTGGRWREIGVRWCGSTRRSATPS